MYRALITDLDGTAVPISADASSIEEETCVCVQKALAANKKIAVATGREWVVAKPLVEKLGLVSPCVIEGGTHIIDPRTGATLWAKELESGMPERILEIFKRESQAGLLIQSENIARQPIDQVSDIPPRLRFMYLVSVPAEVGKRVAKAIIAQGLGAAHLTPAWSGQGFVDVHVTHREATKGHALRVWHELEQVSQRETIGMGDSGNDIPIFQAAGLKIAVENATDDLKKLADHVLSLRAGEALRYVINDFLLAAR